ncbi:hypothetical protein Poli38472_008660 [Pythium oligandrum]|uniref:NADH-ubiquinone reductase complex 1 MLRQ subunit n=1 Tax=Pythium oligandrum TaxID=41045 RepID=A0A8K1FDW4_PYTOL|nr:hypothetical protein Poli38472_008660 [Pythium oligandrum]|eukprot:TMW56012.1 hypothetical protein Poli38472_008660 [Pythium oligandrum]
MVAARATRSGISLLKLWTTDKGTFPIVLIAAGAATAASVVATRYLFFNPDVYFDKERRFAHMHHDGDVGSRWRQFRFRFANYDRNPINQSRQYDPLYEKPENQAVKR